MAGHAHDGLPGGMAPLEAARITRITALLSVSVALILMAIKAWSWAASGSVSMLSSLADSALDGAASVFTLLAVTYAARPPDAEHRYGHGKAEGFAALFQAVLVGVSATLIAIEAVRRVMAPQPISHSLPALIVMGVSIALTIALVFAQTRAVRRTGSVATAGDRAHYLADIAANLVVVAGIVGSAFLGVIWFDPLIGLAVAGWLAWSALGVAQAGIDQLLDRELPDAARERIAELAVDGREILSVHQLRTRAAGPYVHILFHADMPKSLSLVEAHDAMVRCEERIQAVFPAADVHIHPDPKGVAEPHGMEAYRIEPDRTDAA